MSLNKEDGAEVAYDHCDVAITYLERCLDQSEPMYLRPMRVHLEQAVGMYCVAIKLLEPLPEDLKSRLLAIAESSERRFKTQQAEKIQKQMAHALTGQVAA